MKTAPLAWRDPPILDPRFLSEQADVDALRNQITTVVGAAQFNGLNKALPGIGITLALKIAKQMSQYLRQTSGRLIDHLGD